MAMSNLTGRTRYRVGWFGQLVLQAEVLDFRYRDEGETIWRDARCEDFNAFGELFAKAPVPYPGQRPVCADSQSSSPTDHGPTDMASTWLPAEKRSKT
jgi:hypothetical protein